MSTMRTSRFICAALSVVVSVAFAKEAIAREPYGVAIQVSTDDKDVQARLQSQLRKDLRSFSDLSVVDAGSRHFEILLFVVGDYTSFSIAAVGVEIGAGYTTSHPSVTPLRALCDANVLTGAGSEHLKEAATSIVASFDSKCVEPARRALRSE
jgi:hypothetical protein